MASSVHYKPSFGLVGWYLLAAVAAATTQLERGLDLHALGDLDGALAVLEDVVDDGDASADVLGVAWHTMAAIRHVRGETHAAVRDIEEASAACQNSTCAPQLAANVANTRGVVYRSLGRTIEAKEALERALALVPDHGHAASNLAHLLCVASLFVWSR